MDLERYFRQIRETQKNDLITRIKEAETAIPELKSLEDERRTLFTGAAKGTQNILQSTARIGDIAKKEAALLEEHGFPKDQLSLRYVCEACHDTGWVGQTKRPCSCRLLKQAETDPDIGINLKETFAAFSDGIYPTTEQRERSVRAKQRCEQFANSLPGGKEKNLVLLGGCGLGKSYLGNAVAHRSLEKSIPARRITAYQLIQHTMNDISGHTDGNIVFFKVPLLILDDLGSEPIIPNVSEETLLALLDTRQAAGLHTVVISNLSLKELQNRYGERIFSRLCDQTSGILLQLSGTNLRWGKSGC